MDISLTATGLAIVEDDPIKAESYVYRTRPDDGSLANRRQRIAGIVNAVTPYCVGADLVAVEGPSFRSIGGKAHDRAGLWWAVVGRISATGTPVVEIPPTVRMLWACGKGRASKADVQQSMAALWPDVSIPDDNAADALALASMAAQHRGLPIVLSPHHHAAHRSVRWPVSAGVNRSGDPQ